MSDSMAMHLGMTGWFAVRQNLRNMHFSPTSCTQVVFQVKFLSDPDLVIFVSPGKLPSTAVVTAAEKQKVGTTSKKWQRLSHLFVQNQLQLKRTPSVEDTSSVIHHLSCAVTKLNNHEHVITDYCAGWFLFGRCLSMTSYSSTCSMCYRKSNI